MNGLWYEWYNQRTNNYCDFTTSSDGTYQQSEVDNLDEAPHVDWAVLKQLTLLSWPQLPETETKYLYPKLKTIR